MSVVFELARRSSRPADVGQVDRRYLLLVFLCLVEGSKNGLAAVGLPSAKMNVNDLVTGEVVQVLPKWHWRDGRTITSREVIELLCKVIERGVPIHRGTLESSPVQLLYRAKC